MTDWRHVLEVLYDLGDAWISLYRLGQSSRLGPERLAQAIEEIETRGQHIEKSPHGLRLTRPVALDAHLIERRLKVERVGRNVICFNEVASTNDVAFDAARQQGDADGLAVFAEKQRKGRGRLGREWSSPPRANVLMSMLLVDEELPHEPLTIAAGLACAEAIESMFNVHPKLKWPNDVLIDGDKVAGVIVETRRIARRRCIVVGIGINVNAKPETPTDSRVTCLADHAHTPIERTELCAALLARLDHWVTKIKYHQADDLHKAWLERCDMINTRISVVCKGRSYVGRVLDIDPMRGLCLCLDSGVNIRLEAAYSSIQKTSLP